MIALAISSCANAAERAESMGATHVIQILGPRDNAEFPDLGLPSLRLLFDDANSYFNDDVQVPTLRDVSAVVRFGRSIPDGSRVLVHCGLGRSRCAAVALILLATRIADEDDAVDALMRFAPNAHPNSLVIELADKYLGRNGLLSRAATRPTKATSVMVAA